jgi:hypothetical protein
MLFTFPAEENDLCVFPLIFMDCNSLGIVWSSGGGRDCYQSIFCYCQNEKKIIKNYSP